MRAQHVLQSPIGIGSLFLLGRLHCERHVHVDWPHHLRPRHVGFGELHSHIEYRLHAYLQRRLGVVELRHACQSGVWASQGRSFGNLTSFTFSDNGVSQGATTGYHDICVVTGIYQNGNNGWVYMSPGASNAAGKRNYTVTSTCAAQGCGAGALAVTVNCWDFL